jgi:hypothetical protein
MFNLMAGLVEAGLEWAGLIGACPEMAGHVGAGLRPAPIRLKNDQLPDYGEDDR